MKTISTLTALLATLLVAAPAARADGCGYGVIVIRNPTGAAVNYQIKWGGNGTWASYRLASGYYHYHSYPLDGDYRAPRPHVRFDSHLGDGQVTPKSYGLGFYSTHHPGYDTGKKYYFAVSGCSLYLHSQ